MLVDFIDPRKVTYLPNTAGCFTGEDAVRTLRLAREAGGWSLVKLEVLGEKKLLYPDMLETLRATEMLTKDGFQVMVYCSDDPLMAKRLEEMGAVAIMPLAAPIGSGMGIQSTVNIRMIVEDAKVPVIVDAGVGTASDAAVAMELGCDAVLMNTAIAEAKNPILMAHAMRHAVEAGRLAYLAGRMPKKRYADPSSPLAGLILEGMGMTRILMTLVLLASSAMAAQAGTNFPALADYPAPNCAKMEKPDDVAAIKIGEDPAAYNRRIKQHNDQVARYNT